MPHSPPLASEYPPIQSQYRCMESPAAVFDMHSGGLKPRTLPVRFALQMGKSPFSEPIHLINRRRQIK
jgi:hypothetical protein